MERNFITARKETGHLSTAFSSYLHPHSKRIAGSLTIQAYRYNPVIILKKNRGSAGWWKGKGSILIATLATGMKKIILILIGIVIGIIASFIFALCRTAPFYYVFDDKPLLASVKDLHVIEVDDTYGIVLQNNTNLIVSISVSPDRKIISDISIINAREYQDFSFSDTDSNGAMDRWIFSDDKSTFFYGRMNGHPDAVFSEPDELVVRIDGKYFLTREIDGVKFININNALVEIEHIGNQCYKVKK